MNIFKVISTKLNRGKVLKLNTPKKKNIDNIDSKKTITISSIRSILGNEETFEKFLDWNQNQDFFGEGLFFEDYIQASKDYISYFMNRGVTFGKDELKRASIITGEKYKNSKEKKKVGHTVDELIANTIYNTGTIESIVNNDNQEIDEVLKDKIYELPKIFSSYKVCLDNSIINTINQLRQKDIDSTIAENDINKINSQDYTVVTIDQECLEHIPDDVDDFDERA